MDDRKNQVAKVEQTPVVQKKRDFLNPQIAMSHYTALVIIMGLFALWAHCFITSLFTHDLFGTLYGAFLFIGFVWGFSGTVICSIVYIYMYRHLQARNAERLAIVATRARNLIRKLPIYKGIAEATLLNIVALARLQQGNYETAESLFRDVLQEMQRFHLNKGRVDWLPYLMMAHNNLAIACARQGNFVEADLLIDQGFELLNQSKAKKLQLYTAYLDVAAAAVKCELHELPAAEAHIFKAFKTVESSPNTSSLGPFLGMLIAQCNLQLAVIYALQGDCGKASKFVDLITANKSDLSTLSLKWLNLLANECMEHHAYDLSERALKLAYEIARNCPYHPDAQKTLDCFEKQLVLTDRPMDVPDMRRWLHLVE